MEGLQVKIILDLLSIRKSLYSMLSSWNFKAGYIGSFKL